MSTAIGQSINRVDGRAKVTGAGRYSAEIALDNMTYAVLLGAHVASGRISAIDTSEAESVEGVLAVLTHRNLGRIAAQPPLLPSLVGQPAPGETFFPLQDEVVHYAGQPVAIVVADTLEHAQHAATLVRISYEEMPSTTTLDQGRDHAYEPERIFGGLLPGRQERGDVEAGLAGADVSIDVTYRFAANHHNPIEPSATRLRPGRVRGILEDTTPVVGTLSGGQVTSSLLPRPVSLHLVLSAASIRSKRYEIVMSTVMNLFHEHWFSHPLWLRTHRVKPRA